MLFYPYKSPYAPNVLCAQNFLWQMQVAFELGWGGKPPGESTFVQGILKEFKFRASQRSTTATITFTPTNADHCEIPISEIKLTPSTSPTEHVIGIRLNKQKDVVINCKVVVEKDKGEADPLSPQSIRPIQVADPPASQLAAKDTTWAVHLQFSEFKSSLKDDFGDYRAEAPPLTDGVVLERTAWRDGQLKPFTDDHKAVSKLLGKGCVTHVCKLLCLLQMVQECLFAVARYKFSLYQSRAFCR